MWPAAPTRPLPPILSAGSLGIAGLSLGALTAAPASVAPGAAIQSMSALYVRDQPQVIRKVGWYNGATAAGNVELAIYDASLQQVQTTGSVAQAGTNAIQEVNWTDLTLDVGTYYVAIGFDTATATFFCWGLPSGDPLAASTVQNYVKVAGLPLPNPLSGFIPSNFMPIWVLSSRTLLA